jgi:hypothetical protein
MAPDFYDAPIDRDGHNGTRSRFTSGYGPQMWDRFGLAATTASGRMKPSGAAVTSRRHIEYDRARREGDCSLVLLNKNGTVVPGFC